MGIIPGTPIGRDLRRVKHVIAVGGIFTHRTPKEKLYVLEQSFANPGISLLPAEPHFIVDEQYLLYAVGVLGQKYSDACLNFARLQFKIDKEGE
jgi:hypothetical protein